MIAHNLLSPAKLRVLRSLSLYRYIDRIVVHSPNQIALLGRVLGPLVSRLRVVPYGVDTDFWSPAVEPATEEPAKMIISAGREHRDYRTLLAARPEASQLFIADHSLHSPDADRQDPVVWPAEVERAALSPLELRERYATAAVVVVPIVETPFPAGITTLLESMSMGKAVVVSDTDGLRGVVEHGRSGIVVPPGDARALREAIVDLMDHPEKRCALGAEARQAVVRRFSVDRYVDALADQLREVALGSR
jgi:glycosyltransferase involved in cell wall biosynthesis